jgi:phytoene dehydrogenase-like protein
MWDVIVIGSGISGLGAAAALARQGRRVLVLEQHSVAGGLTQTFTREDWTFATGVHYIGGVGDIAGSSGQIGRLLAWLTDGALRFVSCGNPYDIVRLPGFEFGIRKSATARLCSRASRRSTRRSGAGSPLARPRGIRPSRGSRCAACLSGSPGECI